MNSETSNILHPIREISVTNFNYDLPENLIALHPLEQRDRCRLLVATPDKKGATTESLFRVLPDKASISHHRFDQITDLIPENTLIVRNNTKVINARLHFKKESGASIEIFLLDPISPADYAINFQQTRECVWKCLVGNLKKWKEGPLTATITLPDSNEVTIRAFREQELDGKAQAIRFVWEPEYNFGDIISSFGNIPIPPYLNREAEESDLTDYQTVYAKDSGSVAAPTAGLHFTDELFDCLRKSKKNISVADVTLHVGAGTFRPVKSETIGGHPMHSETFTITRSLVEKLLDALDSQRLVLAVGTTTVRTLESLQYIGSKLLANRIENAGLPYEKLLHVNQWDPYDPDVMLYSKTDALRALITEMNFRNTDSLTASTEILIGPGYDWKLVEAMITNFHQPESTLLLLVSSFLGLTPDEVGKRDALWRIIYEEAIREGYRFLSYGDACLFFRHPNSGFHSLELPGSKSISNRALVLNALSGGETEITGISDSTDTETLKEFIRLVRDFEERRKNPSDELEGRKGTANKTIDFYIGDGATTLRFAIALASVTPGLKVNLFPSSQLMNRLLKTSTLLFPDTPLRVEKINFPVSGINLPADRKKLMRKIKDKNNGLMCVMGYHIEGADLSQGDPIELDAMDMVYTSQEASALLLVSSRLPEMKITNIHKLPSVPYLMMTRSVCQVFGGCVRMKSEKLENHYDVIVTSPTTLRGPSEYMIEADWSALLNFFTFTIASRYSDSEHAIIFNCINSPDPEDSIQPDASTSIFFSYLFRFKGKKNKNLYSVDMFHTPDAIPPFVASCLCAGAKFTLTGIERLLYKESDRLHAMINEFGKLGWTLKLTSQEGTPVLTYNGRWRKKSREDNPLLDSHDDHRIAMALASTLPLTRRFRLRNPMCVAKSMPNFWDELIAVGVSFNYDEETDIVRLEYNPPA